MRVRSKGCGSGMGSTQRTMPKCSICRETGHNKRKCKIRRQMESFHPPMQGGGVDLDGDEEVNFYEEEIDVETVSNLWQLQKNAFKVFILLITSFPLHHIVDIIMF